MSVKANAQNAALRILFPKKSAKKRTAEMNYDSLFTFIK